MKFGIIGNGAQSKRIQKILTKKKITYLIYKPATKNSNKIGNFSEINHCDGVFIMSPNNTHFNYLRKLNRNYVFCEKPPVTKNDHLKILRNMNYKKIYFNFNFRFSKLNDVLENKEKYNLGKLLYANIIHTHGLAYKKSYKKNWRTNIKENSLGIYETVQIHFIDLINFNFKIKRIDKPNLFNKSKIGTSYDTVQSSILTKCGAIINIFSSYKSCLINKRNFCFENGLVEQNEDSLIIRGPAINLDYKGLFKKPKIIKIFKIKASKDYQNSIEKSVEFFIKKCTQKTNFEKKLFSKSIISTDLLINKN
tara:strand:+ start:11 stop:934 length:924 start_codon:yes stop_codon:yes gene_type:complete